MFSVVIPVYNGHEYTQACLESIRSCSSGRVEIIVVDNGSAPAFDEQPCSKTVDRVIRFAKNRGFPVACNVGFHAAKGDVIVALNNDTILTPAWDAILARHLDTGLDVVGPVTNEVSGDQYVQIDRYDSRRELYELAIEHHKKNRGRKLRHFRLVGFCMAFSRLVYKRIGGFDEQFSPGNFEDDDFCLRAIEAGFRVGIAQDLYIHHYGSVTHRELNIEHDKLLIANEKKFMNKWKDKLPELRKKALE